MISTIASRRAALLVASALALALTAGGTAARAQSVASVSIRSNFFEPKDVRIDPGDTVVWNAAASGHTVTAENRAFDYYPHRTLSQGESVQFTFVAEGIYYYYCRVHSFSGDRAPAGMWGRVLVGNVSDPTPTPTATPPPPEERLVPTAQYPDITAALDGLSEGGIVSLNPGTFRESVTVTTPGITIRGLGTTPSASVLDGALPPRGIGITVLADRVRIENLTVRNYESTGLIVSGGTGVVVDRVHATSNGLVGVEVNGARGAVVKDSVATGHGSAGFLVGKCRECGARVERVTAVNNFYGIVTSNAEGVTIRDSEARGNMAGVVLRSVVTGKDAIGRGTHLWRNSIHDNSNASAPRAKTPVPSLDLPVRAGIWIAGGWHNVVEANTVAGERTGILVSMLGLPAIDDRIVGNVVSGSSAADLAWDGIGANVCFSGNTSPAGEPTGSPAQIQTLYSCSAPATAGVPNPAVLADFLTALVTANRPAAAAPAPLKEAR